MSATTAFDYDKRGRLIEEMRSGGHAYWLQYEYDQGGNRQRKLQRDPTTGDITARTTYRYDTDEADVDCDGDGTTDRSPAECYGHRNNRLMYYTVEVWYNPGGIEPGFRKAEVVWYQYEVNHASSGNPTYIVKKTYNPAAPSQEPFCVGTMLGYGNNGEVRFISQQAWQEGPNLDCGMDAEVTSFREFRSVGRNMRFTADRTPNGANIIESTRVWHDYDGDEIYGDLRLDFDGALQGFTEAEIASHEPGIGTHDWTAAAGSQTTYRHGDQIGSTRAISNQPTSGDPTVTGRIVYTAFGERVWSDGAIGTRYQYAGAWGYQTMPEYASGMSHGLGGAPGDEVPFVHVGHRWYDPATGRFLQRDPIGIAGGLNVYEYVRNRPTMGSDPQGLLAPAPGFPPPPGVTPGFGFRRDIDFLDVFSIAHFCIPAYISAKGGKFAQAALIPGIVVFEVCEPKLADLNPAYYYETDANVMGDVIIGLLGIWLGPILFFCRTRHRRAETLAETRMTPG